MGGPPPACDGRQEVEEGFYQEGWQEVQARRKGGLPHVPIHRQCSLQGMQGHVQQCREGYRRICEDLEGRCEAGGEGGEEDEEGQKVRSIEGEEIDEEGEG